MMVVFIQAVILALLSVATVMAMSIAGMIPGFVLFALTAALAITMLPPSYPKLYPERTRIFLALLVGSAVTFVLSRSLGVLVFVPSIGAYAGLVISEVFQQKKNDEERREAEMRKAEILKNSGPAVIPLTEDETLRITQQIYSQFVVWTDSKYDHSWVCISFKSENVEFGAIGSCSPFKGFKEFITYPHRVFGPTIGMNMSDFPLYYGEQKSYRMKLAQQVLSYLKEHDVTHLADQLWIDDIGDILSTSQH